MTLKPGFVFDTNVVISAALLKQSIARTAFDKALDVGEILTSVEMIDELYPNKIGSRFTSIKL